MTIEQIKRRLAQLAELRKAATKRSSDVLDATLAENRSTTADEAKILEDARAEVNSIDGEARGLNVELKSLEAAEADAAEAKAAGDAAEDEKRKDEAAEAAKRTGGAKIRKEPLTYEQHSAERSYLQDLVMAETGYGRGERGEARERLMRHAGEMRVEAGALEARQGKAPETLGEGREERAVEYEKRDLNRTDGTGGYFVPPLWMMDAYIDLARGGRVMADLCNRAPLPAGTDSINIPKIATGTATAIQTADNAAVQETDLTDTTVQANVKTIAGQQDVAIQALEQSPLGFDQIIMADLADDHAVKTDLQVISGTNASNQVMGILTIPSVDTTTYTDASPTVPELYPKLADSWQQIATTRFRVPQVIAMHPRRWAWWLAAVDASNRPLATMPTQGPNNALASVSANMAEGGPVGQLPFGPVVVDPNIPTNLGSGTDEDRIIMTRPSELNLWESAIRTRVLPEVLSGTLTVRIQLYNYLAFMPHRRPESTSVIGGTGLATPTF